MGNIATKIKEEIVSALELSYGHKMLFDDIMLEHPKNLDFGDYATNIAIQLASTLKQNPMDIAKNVCYEINKRDHTFEFDGEKYELFSTVNVAFPGFINFKLSNSWLCFVLDDISIKGTSYGVPSVIDRKTIALEHSNVNPNKAAHVGHLRNACIGQFIEKIYEFIGNDVHVQYYDNDLGMQVTTSLMGTEELSNISIESYDKFDHYAWDVYSQMESIISKDESLVEKRQEIMSKLEDCQSEESKKQVALSQKILIDQLKTFSDLDFDYDVIIRERDIVTLKLWEDAFLELKKNKNVYKATSGPSKDCWLIKLGGRNGGNGIKNHEKGSEIAKENSEEKFNVEEDKIIVRSNGVPTYTGKDIAYHMWKFGLLNKDFYYKNFKNNTQEKPLYITASEEFFPNSDVSFMKSDIVLNVIDAKQTYALEAVRQALKYLGYEKEANNMTHINYGFVYLSSKTAEKLGIDVSDGKKRYDMSGRKGWGVKIDDFIKMVDATLIESFGKFDALKDVRNGAIKFEMLKYNTFQDLIFDLDSALDINGYSGPYIQYAHARANSVLEKGAYIKDSDLASFTFKIIQNNLHKKELNLLRHLYIFPEVVKRSAEEFAPNLMCTYLFELAQKFNSFYNDIPILTADTDAMKNFRLSLTLSSAQIIKNGLSLLGIKAPMRM